MTTIAALRIIDSAFEAALNWIPQGGGQGAVGAPETVERIVHVAREPLEKGRHAGESAHQETLREEQVPRGATHDGLYFSGITAGGGEGGGHRCLQFV
jgi:hypothetical protein